MMKFYKEYYGGLCWRFEWHTAHQVLSFAVDLLVFMLGIQFIKSELLCRHAVIYIYIGPFEIGLPIPRRSKSNEQAPSNQ